MIKYLNHHFYIVILFCLAVAQHEISIEELHTKGNDYYNLEDYDNAIIIYENLLAEQELDYEYDDIQIAITLTRLGEMYSHAGISDIAEYYFQQAISIFEKSFQANKKSLEIPLLNLMKIYSFNKDIIMEKNTENRLSSLTTLFHTLEQNKSDSILTQSKLFSPEEDNAIDLMELGMTYINNGLFSEAAMKFSQALNYQTGNCFVLRI